MSAYARALALEHIQRLAGEGLDVKSFFTEANEALSIAVPSDMGTSLTPFWYTLDPASLLITSVIGEGCDLSVDDVMRFEYVDDDFNKAVDVARNPRGIQTLTEATGGDPNRSRVYRDYMRPMGMDQEALVALRTRTGENWGTLRLVRAPGRSEFDADELGFLRAAAPYLAEGARRGLLVGEASEPDGPGAPGLVVLDEDWTVDSLTPGVERWLSQLPGGWKGEEELPPSLLAVAARAVRIADGEEFPGEVAASRVLSRQGRWIMLHGAALPLNGGRRAAVIVEPAHPARITPLLMAIYGLTEREQEVARLVLHGDSTAQVAEALCLSPHTVQEHLKSIFEKTGVHSRGQLVAKVFFSHYDPRVRDNESRAAASEAIRGGPFPHEPA